MMLVTQLVIQRIVSTGGRSQEEILLVEMVIARCK